MTNEISDSDIEAVARALYESGFNKGNYDEMKESITPDTYGHFCLKDLHEKAKAAIQAYEALRDDGWRELQTKIHRAALAEMTVFSDDQRCEITDAIYVALVAAGVIPQPPKESE